jgi:hypothetical protein
MLLAHLNNNFHYFEHYERQTKYEYHFWRFPFKKIKVCYFLFTTHCCCCCCITVHSIRFGFLEFELKFVLTNRLVTLESGDETIVDSILRSLLKFNDFEFGDD